MPVISTNFLIGISFVLYAAVVTPNTSALLVPRAPQDNMCGQLQWLYRECAPGRNILAWDDVCQNAHYQISVSGPNCPPGTYCENTIDFEGDVLIATIQCIARTAPGVSQSRMRANDPQIGSSSKIQATNSLANSQRYHQVIIADDMLASVSAFFLSDDESHVIDPQNVIVGKIRGKEIEVCTGDPSNVERRKECYPTGRQQLWQGDTVDFSWGLKSNEAGSLKYLVWPSDPL